MAVYLGSTKVALKGGTFYTNGVPINNQNKTVTPTTSTQTITADSGYTGLGTVTVNRIPTNYIIPSGTLSVTTNGIKDVTAYASINVNVPTGSVINNQDKTVTPTTSQQFITCDSGYTGLGTVTVNRIPTNYIIPSGNKEIISNGTNIDVSTYSTVSVAVPTGSGTTPVIQSLTITPTTTQQTFNSSSVDGYKPITVTAVPTGTAGNPIATKGTVSNHSISITPSVTNTTGYISGSTKTGTAVTVTASELASGNKAITQNGNNIDVVGYSTVSVNVEGGGGSGSSVLVGEVEATSTTASISFSGLLGEPTSFYISFVGASGIDLPTGTPYKIIDVVYDGTTDFGNIATNTSNAQASYSTNFSHTYSNGTLMVTGTNSNFIGHYLMLYTYGNSTSDIHTKDVQVGSGATSITFTGLDEEPTYWSCAFKSDFGTSSGYQRTISIAYGYTTSIQNVINGYCMSSGVACSTTNWTSSYNNGSLTISSRSTTQGGYFHQPGYYQLTYAVNNSGGGSGSGTYQTKTVSPTTSQQVITADSGYDALSQVTVNAMPTGTAGTPTATKSSRVGNSITVTPTVTNTTGYISGGTLTGTGVSVSASEVTNGTYSITADGTYNIANYASVSVNVGGGGDTPQPSGVTVATATRTLTSASSSISFTGLSGEPTSFAVCTSAGLSTGASPWKTAMVVYNGSTVQGDFITNTNNQQLATSTSTTYSSITFGQSYSNGTLTITGSGSNFQANEYKLVYTYNGSTSDVQTKTQTVGSGATSITFSGLSGTPKYFACIFEGTAGYYSTSNGYQRVIGVVYNGTSTYGVSMGSGAVASTTAWTYTYNNGSLTITSAGTNNGGYFHQATNVNYKLIYVV